MASRFILAGGLVMALFGVTFGLLRVSFLGDFRAFYCAGLAARAGANPYKSEPLHSCELATMEKQSRKQWTSIAIPAPIPPYSVAFFAIISLLPFWSASFIWMLMIIFSNALAIAAVVRLTALSIPGVVCAFLLSLFALTATLGQLVSIPIAATCVAALFLREQRWRFAAVAASVTMLEPRIGIPVCLSMAVWLPRTRIALLLCAILMLAASSVFSLHMQADYLFHVLPMHAASEIGSDEQYSLSVILRELGLPVQTALFAGGSFYAIMVGAGVILARRVSTQLNDEAFLALLPPALATLGGPFVHLTQVAVAIPTLLLLISRADRRCVRPAFVALLLIAIPWPMARSLALTPLAGLIAFTLGWEVERRNFLFAATSAVAGIGMVLCIHRALDIHSAAQHAVIAQIDPHYPQASWAKLIAGSFSHGDAASWWKRVPTWLGLLVTAGSTMGIALPSRGSLYETSQSRSTSAHG